MMFGNSSVVFPVLSYLLEKNMAEVFALGPEVLDQSFALDDSGEKLHPCLQCNKTFCKQDYLNTHLLSHGEKKMFGLQAGF